MYARNEKNKIVYYSDLPKKIKDEEGRTLMNLKKLTDEELETYGFYPVEIPDINPFFQEYLDDWKLENKKYIRKYQDKTIKTSESIDFLNVEFKKHCVEIYYHIKFYEEIMSKKQQSIPSEVNTQISNFYQFVIQEQNKINALKKKEDFISYSLPLNEISNYSIYFINLY